MGAGGVAQPGARGMPAQLGAAGVEGSGQAFVDGPHSAVVVTGVLCLIGAVAATAGTGRRSRETAGDAEAPAVVAAH